MSTTAVDDQYAPEPGWDETMRLDRSICDDDLLDRSDTMEIGDRVLWQGEEVQIVTNKYMDDGDLTVVVRPEQGWTVEARVCDLTPLPRTEYAAVQVHGKKAETLGTSFYASAYRAKEAALWQVVGIRTRTKLPDGTYVYGWESHE